MRVIAGLLRSVREPEFFYALHVSGVKISSLRYRISSDWMFLHGRGVITSSGLTTGLPSNRTVTAAGSDRPE